ncbi:hypothetical protein L914_05702 [Phytophthora nicotianae]|uniref:Uncharacterized protein n=1 Tax=Phytophthora nicotianae TaxID=4792 RepID=W2NNT8_PHYNI|nr:hypothetical protein L914_05702 [Phytophthora nicotianae]
MTLLEADIRASPYPTLYIIRDETEDMTGEWGADDVGKIDASGEVDTSNRGAASDADTAMEDRVLA